jgi:lambda repressor-like predicted transcriptional regulator
MTKIEREVHEAMQEAARRQSGEPLRELCARHGVAEASLRACLGSLIALGPRR